MKFYLTKTPRIIQQIFKNYTWCFSSDKKEIFLTFDDGPTPEITEFVLSKLKKHNAKATFFCIGKNIQNHPEIFNKIIAEKHVVGNHTQNHLNGLKHKKINYLENVVSCENVISSTSTSLSTGSVEKSANSKTPGSKLFRPPYGKIKKSQAKEILKKGYTIIMWDVLSADFDTSISKEKCLENVLKNTTNGSIIVFHDSKKAVEKLIYVLPKVLDYFSEKGFVFKTIA
ncbi:Peptidoglycan-N-acetylglucosamine deacetylase [Polaribacter huanghezhanensis]|uniref:polysaccharide deacetylase family protein n=1 Tax=Polaribacter huanghezhanensis TaxID=1354726 RepID=UPI002647FFC6|nr:polysaccharide deacetylase family protein [Polaribacter huanghezhanensis]WKD85729.1 Peptidoglycan-N-acetylglucosamine deacetylase [Polaribacter huanghezhanensis]